VSATTAEQVVLHLQHAEVPVVLEALCKPWNRLGADSVVLKVQLLNVAGVQRIRENLHSRILDARKLEGGSELTVPEEVAAVVP